MKITINRIVVFFVLLTYLKPYNATLIEPVNNMYSLLKIFATILLLVCVLSSEIRFTKSSIICICLVVLWLISIICNNGSFGANLQQILSVFGMIILVNYLKPMRDGMMFFLKMLHHISVVYIFLHFVTVLIDRPLFAEPIVVYEKYFLGADNYSAFILIPLVGFVFSYELFCKGRVAIGAWIVAVAGFLSLAIPFSVAGMIAYAIFLALIILRKFKLVKRLADVPKVLVIMTIFLAGVIISFNGQNFEFSILGKTGLNSREIIWAKVMDLVKERPLIGYGELTDSQIASYVLYGTNHAHNYLLEFLLDVGIIGLLIMFVWLYFILKDIKNNKNDVLISLNFCVVSYLLCGIFDFYIGLIYFWLLMLVIEIYKKYYKCNQIYANE